MTSTTQQETRAMDMQACTEALRAKVGDSSGLNATLKFDCGADGVAYIDGKSVPNSVDNDNRESDCTLEITISSKSPGSPFST